MHAGDGNFLVSLMSGEHGTGDSALLKHHQITIICKNLTRPVSLNGKSLYALYAHLLDSARRTISCRGKLLQPIALNFELNKGVMKLGDESHDLTRAVHEMVAANSNRGISYQASESQTQAVHINVNRYGVLQDVSIQREADVVICMNLDKPKKAG